MPSVVELAVRSLVSLGIVLAIVAVAYLVAKRRRGGGTPRPTVARGTRRRTGVNGVEVVGRVGLGRTSSAVAIRFCDRIVLVAASDQGATTLCEMPAGVWDEFHTVREPIDDLGGVPDQRGTAGTGFVEALRQATTRHA